MHEFDNMFCGNMTSIELEGNFVSTNFSYF